MRDEAKTKRELIEELKQERRRAGRAERAARKLKERHVLLEASLQAISTGVTVADARGTILYTNRAEAAMHGYRSKDLIGRHVSVFMPQDARQDSPAGNMTGWTEWTREVTEVRKDGSLFPVRLTSMPVTDAAGRPACVITLSEDMTRGRVAELALARSEERYRSLVESTDDSIYLVDRNCTYLFMNRKHQERLGVAADEYRGRPYGDLHTRQDARWFAGKVKAVFEKSASLHMEHRSRKGGRTFLLTFSPVLDGEGKVWAVNVISKNITKLKSLEEELRALSLTDDLTGLYNRRGFFTLVEQQLRLAERQKKPIFLLYADVNGLKLINDRFGHREGDRLLADVGRLLKENYRTSDIIARIGGDEFVVIPIDKKEGTEGVITGRIRGAVERYNTAHNGRYALSISVGVALYDPASPCTVEELLSAADESMYRDKRGAPRAKKRASRPRS